MVIVPPDSLQPETLRLLIEEFITREGAIHGHHEAPLEQQIHQVLAQLQAGTVVIVFDPESESCTLIPRQNLAAGPGNNCHGDDHSQDIRKV